MAAQGTLILFDEFADSIADGRIDLLTDTLKVALTSDIAATGIVKTATIPCWGAGGTTNISTNEVSAGGGYTAGGKTLASKTMTQAAGVGTFDAADLTGASGWVSAASGDPTNIKTAVIYSDTATNKDCIAFIEMTADSGTTAVSLLAGDVTIAWSASGIFTITNP